MIRAKTAAASAAPGSGAAAVRAAAGARAAEIRAEYGLKVLGYGKLFKASSDLQAREGTGLRKISLGRHRNIYEICLQ